MIKAFAIFIVLFIIFTVVVLPSYLGPDDIKNCDGPSEQTGCQPADAIIAVSGGDTIARTDEAIKQYKAGWSNLLIFSGAAADTTGPSNAQVMQRRAIDKGVAADRIFIEEFSRTTAENAKNTAAFLSKNDIDRVMLVTSSYHQRRAGLEFQSRVGTDLEIVNHPVASDKQWSYFWWLKPSGLYLAYSELIKIVLFYARGAV